MLTDKFSSTSYVSFQKKQDDSVKGLPNSFCSTLLSSLFYFLYSWQLYSKKITK